MPYRPKIKNSDGSLTDLPLEAETAVKLKTARTIGLSGVTATAQSFNGTGNITIPVTAVPASLITGTIAAGTAEKAVKEADGSYSAITVNESGYVTNGNRIYKSKEPHYLSTIGTSYTDYAILSGDYFPTPGQAYEVAFEDNGVLMTFDIIWPAKGNYTYVERCFSLMFHVAKSNYDVRIHTGSEQTYKYILWKIDHTNKKVLMTKCSAGQCAATTVYFKGMYKLNEKLGA